MSQQPEPPTEGDEKFEQKVEQRMADTPDADPEGSYSNAPQEGQKSDLPVLEEDEDSVATPGSSDA
ncbi:hypothetical protein ACT4S5_02420 [Kocuria oceani]|uniref:hypothetical protein n=1 Tax=Kocuria oceani TaxID=988827 RepID=UPI004036D0B3